MVTEKGIMIVRASINIGNLALQCNILAIENCFMHMMGIEQQTYNETQMCLTFEVVW